VEEQKRQHVGKGLQVGPNYSWTDLADNLLGGLRHEGRVKESSLLNVFRVKGLMVRKEENRK